MRERRGDKPCSVYVMTCTTGQHILAKVGVSANPAKRASGVQTGCPFQITGVQSSTFRSRAVAEAVEVAIHIALNRYRTHGEWFKFHPSDIETLFAAFEQAAKEHKGSALQRHSLMARTVFRRAG